VNDGHEEEINKKMMKGLEMGRKRKGCTNQGDVSDRDRQLRRRVGKFGQKEKRHMFVGPTAAILLCRAGEHSLSHQPKIKHTYLNYTTHSKININEINKYSSNFYPVQIMFTTIIIKIT